MSYSLHTLARLFDKSNRHNYSHNGAVEVVAVLEVAVCLLGRLIQYLEIPRAINSSRISAVVLDVEEGLCSVLRVSALGLNGGYLCLGDGNRFHSLERAAYHPVV